MNYFALECVDYETCISHHFMHPDKTGAMFNNDCQELVKEAATCLIEVGDYMAGDDIVDILAVLLKRRGYIPVHFHTVDYENTTLSHANSSDKWRTALGDLYDQVVRVNFHATIKYGKSDSVFINENLVYHKADCPDLLASCGTVIYELSLSDVKKYTPCEVCFP